MPPCHEAREPSRARARATRRTTRQSIQQNFCVLMGAAGIVMHKKPQKIPMKWIMTNKPM